MINKNFKLDFKFFITNIAFILPIFFLIALIIISFYKIFYSLYDNQNTFYFYIIVICFFLIIFFFVCLLYLSIQLKIGFSLTIFVFVISFVLFETYLEIKNIKNIFNNENLSSFRIEAANKKGVDFDKRNFLELYDDLKKEEISLKLNISAYHFLKNQEQSNQTGQLVSLGGPSNSYKSIGNELGYFSIIKTDEHGFNNSSGFYNQKIDIGLIGDSYIAGQAVHQEKNITSILRKKDFKSLSFGRVGIGPLIEYAIFKEYVELIKPKFVFWFFYVNDFNDLMYEKKFSQLTKYLENDSFTQNLFDRQIEIDDLYAKMNNKEFNKIKSQSEEVKAEEIKAEKSLKINFIESLIRILKMYNIRKILGITPKPTYDSIVVKDFKKIIKRAKIKTIGWGGEFYFVFLPSYEHVATKNYNEYENVLKIVDDLDVNFINMYEVLFKNHNDPLSLFPFRFNGHYNEIGYKLVAEEIIKSLESK